MFNTVYHGKRALVTGHTGFKGSWLYLWLRELGAEVAGYALPPLTEPNHFELLGGGDGFNDLRNFAALQKCLNDFQPEVVFHLAAQPLVRESYATPRETFEINVQGTVNLLEACRKCSSPPRAIMVITSDKCYENREWRRGYREDDQLGGYDPYSASKGCAELVAAAYLRSFFNPDAYGKTHHTLAASCRAGNVVGGGDWAADRLVPDIMRAISSGQPLKMRNPEAVRPWQHVLEPLSGYLALGQKLLEGETGFSGAWNFGPAADGAVTVRDVVGMIKREWPAFEYEFCDQEHPHEAGLLRLDCSKALEQLGWHGVWDCERTFAHTVRWYRDFYANGTVASGSDLTGYINDAKRKKLAWTE